MHVRGDGPRVALIPSKKSHPLEPKSPRGIHSWTSRWERGMARKRKAAKRVRGPVCSICFGAMTLRGTIPPAHIFPELRTYQCSGCGHLRTVEDEAEFAAFEVRQAA
jgi:hypothetical protein